MYFRLTGIPVVIQTRADQVRDHGILSFMQEKSMDPGDSSGCG
jgi:hypothetical protein